MSQPSSDFGAFDIGSNEMEMLPEGNAQDVQPVPPPPQYRMQGFSIYTVMLILSFVFLTTAAIMFFINAGKF